MARKFRSVARVANARSNTSTTKWSFSHTGAPSARPPSGTFPVQGGPPIGTFLISRNQNLRKFSLADGCRAGPMVQAFTTPGIFLHDFYFCTIFAHRSNGAGLGFQRGRRCQSDGIPRSSKISDNSGGRCARVHI